MNVFVAVVGTYEEGGMTVGVYESEFGAEMGLTKYALENEDNVNEYYEIYEYQLGAALDVAASAQEPVAKGEFSELLIEVA